jgi:Thrombospondin type 3 repeat
MKSLGKIVTVVLLTFPLVVSAASPADSTQSAFVKPDTTPKQSVVNAFRYYKTVSPSVSIPTVLEVSFNQESFTFPVFAVYNLTTNGFEPHLFRESASRLETGSKIEANGAAGSTYMISDRNYETYLEFPLHEGANKAEITFTFDKPITASSLSFVLDNYVALPQTISITANTASGVYTALAPTRLHQTNVSFPKTTAAVWHVAFDFVQPLRITEMKFNEFSPGIAVSRGLRFLAQPGQKYEIYFDADRYIQPVRKEAGNLSSSKGVVTFSGSDPIINPSYIYIEVDSDGDSVPDLTDNCISFANSDQKDSDGNGRGDACEDYDRDGIINAKDNCPDIPNQEQIDADADNIGDVCDYFDNRITARMPWLPWAGIGVAGVVLLGLFVLALRYKKDDDK